MRKHINIERLAQTICLTDTSLAFLSGLLVVPAVIVFNNGGSPAGPA